MFKAAKRFTILFAALALGVAAFATAGCAAEKGSGLAMKDVSSIQAYTDGTFYGTGLVEVKVTYKDGVNLSGVSAADYVLEDRGVVTPDFGQVPIKSVEVHGQEVTLHTGSVFSPTEKNVFIYSGKDAEGIRERNSFGVYCTIGWYRDVNGVIHFNGEGYEKNETGLGFQARPCLELKLRHSGEDASAAACLADDKGAYKADGLWQKTVDRQFASTLDEAIAQGKFISFANAGIKVPSTSAAAKDKTADEFVRGYAYIPKDYDPAKGIVFTLQGLGISYWRMLDGTDNDGTGLMYDTATTSWAGKGAIVVNIHDRSRAGAKIGEYEKYYDFVKDDVNVMKYFIDTYKITGPIVLQGNSRGTWASALVIKALAGQPYNPINQQMGTPEPATTKLDKSVYNFTVTTYICNNGYFGHFYDESDWDAVAATGLRVWSFDGEQDTFDSFPNIGKYRAIMEKLKGKEWADENVRATGYTSEIFYPWGEVDHSVTRINGWYFANAAYYGPDCSIDEGGNIVYATKLEDGATYKLKGRGLAAENGRKDYEYKVYDDVFQEWALKTAK